MEHQASNAKYEAVHIHYLLRWSISSISLYKNACWHDEVPSSCSKKQLKCFKKCLLTLVAQGVSCFSKGHCNCGRHGKGGRKSQSHHEPWFLGDCLVLPMCVPIQVDAPLLGSSAAQISWSEWIHFGSDVYGNLRFGVGPLGRQAPCSIFISASTALDLMVTKGDNTICWPKEKEGKSCGSVMMCFEVARWFPSRVNSEQHSCNLLRVDVCSWT